MKFPDCAAFVSVGGEVCRVSVMFIEGVGYFFVGVASDVVEFY